MGQALLQKTSRPQRTDVLGRYYTKPDIGSLLVDQLGRHIPRRLLDLGAGAGSLSSAASSRWRNIELFTVDIDSDVSAHLAGKFTGVAGLKHYHYQADALSDQLFELLGAGRESIDTALCNPPFIVPEWRKGFSEMLESAGFSGCIPVISEVDAALLFLAQNIRLTSENAKVGIILPDSLISASKYREFRKTLLEKYCVEKVIRLPIRAFQNTDALASIVIFKKGAPTADTVPLYRFSNDAGISEVLLIQRDAAIDRLNYDYHYHTAATAPQVKGCTLGSCAIEVRRGRYSSAQLKSMSVPVLHTSDIDFLSFGRWRDFTPYDISDICYEQLGKPVRARPGDILLARVGRNLESKIVGVGRGCPVLSDCLYRLSVPNELRYLLLDQLCSEEGQAWIASRAYGVGARQLTKSDLMEFFVSY